MGTKPGIKTGDKIESGKNMAAGDKTKKNGGATDGNKKGQVVEV